MELQKPNTTITHSSDQPSEYYAKYDPINQTNDKKSEKNETYYENENTPKFTFNDNELKQHLNDTESKESDSESSSSQSESSTANYIILRPSSDSDSDSDFHSKYPKLRHPTPKPKYIPPESDYESQNEQKLDENQNEHKTEHTSSPDKEMNDRIKLIKQHEIIEHENDPQYFEYINYKPSEPWDEYDPQYDEQISQQNDPIYHYLHVFK